MHFHFFSAVLVMSMETLPNELLVRVLMQMEPEERVEWDKAPKPDVSAIDAAGIDRKVRPCLLHMME